MRVPRESPSGALALLPLALRLRAGERRRSTGQDSSELRLELRLVLQPAFPKREDAPALRLQGCPVGLVPRAVPADLGFPVIAVLLGHARAAGAVMTMPEAAVDKDRQPAPGQHDIRIARQVLAVQPV